jgi:hypothetical protein
MTGIHKNSLWQEEIFGLMIFRSEQDALKPAESREQAVPAHTMGRAAPSHPRPRPRSKIVRTVFSEFKGCAAFPLTGSNRYATLSSIKWLTRELP